MLLDRLVRFLLPRQDHFFALLEELANKIEASAAVFAELETAAGLERIGEIAARLKPVETEADAVCQRLYQSTTRRSSPPSTGRIWPG